MSRSVTMPTSLVPSHTGRALTFNSSIRRAASRRLWRGDTTATSLVITSAMRMAVLPCPTEQYARGARGVATALPQPRWMQVLGPHVAPTLLLELHHPHHARLHEGRLRDERDLLVLGLAHVVLGVAACLERDRGPALGHRLDAV